ncbi:autotransporter outer membrane beta-barrel domain-containing protein, partial [Brucella anthropi]|uniref:autotransporter family protein n=1 Tax=Brucella anthropi TaxID=529 RepID=UPI002361DD3D
PTNPTDPTNPTGPTNPSGPADPENPTAPRYSAAAPIYESYSANLQTLNRLPTLQQRVGDRYFDDVSAIVRLAGEGGEPATTANWARVEGAHNQFRNETSAGSLDQRVNTYLLQTGIDGEFYEDSNGRLIGGLTVQYGQANSRISNYSGDGTIDTQGWGGGGTLTWYDNDGFYVDGQVQISSYTSDLYSTNLSKQLSKSNKGTGYAASIEAGQRYVLDDNWSVTPQAQLVWSSVNFDTFKDIYGANVSSQSGESVSGRFGFSAKYSDSWLGSDGLPIDANMYGTANFYQEFVGGTRIDYGGTVLDNTSDDLWAGMGIGGSYRWANKKYTVYGEGSVNSSINHIAESYSFEATIGFQVKL